MAVPYLILGDKEFTQMEHTVVIRWSGPITPAQVLTRLRLSKFKIHNTTVEPADGWPVENEKVMFVEVDSYDHVMKLLSYQNCPKLVINGERLRINMLLPPNGISIRDSIDYLNMCSYCGNDESFYECLLSLLTLVDDLTFLPETNPDDGTDPKLAYCRTAEELTPDKFDTVLTQPLNRKEMESLPKDLMTRIMFHFFKSFEDISNNFHIHYTSNARTPLLVLISKDKTVDFPLNLFVFNNDLILQSTVLHSFIQKDNSAGKKIRHIMTFFLHWARCNKLLNGVYAEEKYNKKCGFNSYILTHMVIHFVQVFSKKKIIHNLGVSLKRVIDYNIDDMFPSVNEFLREFFKYLLRFDWRNDAMYGNRIIPKNITKCINNIKDSPMTILNPLVFADNITSGVSLEELNKLQQLLCNSLLILKKNNMRPMMLFEVNRHATAIRLEKARSWICKRNGNFLHYSLPEIIQTSTEFMVLLNSVIRFDVSTEHVGTSDMNLFATMGVTFVVYGRAWIGRRGMRKKVKNSAENLSNLQLELMISKSFEFSYDEPIAIVNITLSEVDDSKKKIAHFDVICGDVVEIRNAMYFLLDRFIVNNLEELSAMGIMSLMLM